MKYRKTETRDFNCRLCDANWLSFIENNDPCPNATQKDGRHNFDFSKPIKIDQQIEESSSLGKQDKITFH